MKTALLEIKSRSSPDELARLESLRSRYGSYIECKPTDDFSVFVPHLAYRQQLLHHCSVIGVNEIFFVEASVNEIHLMIKVTFSEDQTYSYRYGIFAS